MQFSRCSTIHFISTALFLISYLICLLERQTTSWLTCTVNGKAANDEMESFCFAKGLYILGDEDKVELSYYYWVHYALLGCFLSGFVGLFIYFFVMPGKSLAVFLKEIQETAKGGKREENVALNRLLTKTRIQTDSKGWMISLITFEAITFATPFIQIYLLDNLLRGNFAFLAFHYNDNDYLQTAFPRTAQCDVTKVGVTGSVYKLDVECALALSLIYEKIFYSASCWLMLTVLITSLGVAWRLLTCLLYKTKCFNEIAWKKTGAVKTKRQMILVAIILNHVHSFSEWIYLYYTATNLNPTHLAHFLEKLSRSYSGMDEMMELGNGNLRQDQENNGDGGRIGEILTNGDLQEAVDEAPVIPPRPSRYDRSKTQNLRFDLIPSAAPF